MTMLLKNIEDKKDVVGLYIDLSKAFDTICHSKLLYARYLCSRAHSAYRETIGYLVYKVN